VDRERSDLVATVAHELRSPLTGVKGFTATLLSKWDRFTESQKQLMLRTVDADADRLTRLIGELLDVARIDTGRLSLRKELVDLVDAVSGQLRPISISSGRTISFLADGRPRVWVDRDKLAQIVANLVENAIKHGAGDVTVTVSTADGGGAELIVDDGGKGISPEIRPRIFTKFWKHGSTGGSGLGLYIVGGLVSAHDGVVRVEESPTGGARMRVCLPDGQPDSVR
jgi:signal transduction histidine kinase